MMNGLSLPNRSDLMRFCLPDDFLPDDIKNKYSKIINTTPGVIVKPIDYLNESIQSINFPGISDITTPQQQHSYNKFEKTSGKINIEPAREATYNTPKNPLDCIDKEFKVSFRLNQGLYNYFMIYETIFYQLCKPFTDSKNTPSHVLYLDILCEDGTIMSRIKYIDSYINGIDGLEFDYSKISREVNTFDVSFKFNNIDYDLLPQASK